MRRDRRCAGRSNQRRVPFLRHAAGGGGRSRESPASWCSIVSIEVRPEKSFDDWLKRGIRKDPALAQGGSHRGSLSRLVPVRSGPARRHRLDPRDQRPGRANGAIALRPSRSRLNTPSNDRWISPCRRPTWPSSGFIGSIWQGTRCCRSTTMCCARGGWSFARVVRSKRSAIGSGNGPSPRPNASTASSRVSFSWLTSMQTAGRPRLLPPVGHSLRLSRSHVSGARRCRGWRPGLRQGAGQSPLARLLPRRVVRRRRLCRDNRTPARRCPSAIGRWPQGTGADRARACRDRLLGLSPVPSRRSGGGGDRARLPGKDRPTLTATVKDVMERFT